MVQLTRCARCRGTGHLPDTVLGVSPCNECGGTGLGSYPDSRVAALDARLRAAWRSYLWRRWRTTTRHWTLQLAREPGVYTVGVEVRPDVTHLHVTVRVGVLALTVGTEPR